MKSFPMSNDHALALWLAADSRVVLNESGLTTKQRI
jgi:hypothetical protein